MFDWKDLRTALLASLITFIVGAAWTAIVQFSENISFIEAGKIVASSQINLPFVFLAVLVSVFTTYRISRPKRDKIPTKIKSRNECI